MIQQDIMKLKQIIIQAIEQEKDISLLDFILELLLAQSRK